MLFSLCFLACAALTLQNDVNWSDCSDKVCYFSAKQPCDGDHTTTLTRQWDPVKVVDGCTLPPSSIMIKITSPNTLLIAFRINKLPLNPADGIHLLMKHQDPTVPDTHLLSFQKRIRQHLITSPMFSDPQFKSSFNLTFLPDNCYFFESTAQCAFELQQTDKEDPIATSLSKLIDYSGALIIVADKVIIGTTDDNWLGIVQQVGVRGNVCNRIPFQVINDIKSEYDFTMPQYDRSARFLHCEDPGSKLYAKIYENIYELTSSFCDPLKSEFSVKFINLGTERSYYYTLDLTSTPNVKVGCGVKRCFKPPPFLDCIGCTKPKLISPFRKSLSAEIKCPHLQCPRNMWTADLGGKFSTAWDDNTYKAREPTGIETFREERLPEMKLMNGRYAWRFDNSRPILTGACTQIVNCSVVNPIKDECIRPFFNCKPILITNGTVHCPKFTNLKLMQSRNNSWGPINTSIHCDYITGEWYYSNNIHQDFDTTEALKCIIAEEPTMEWFQPDMTILYSFIVVFSSLSVISVIVIVSLYAYNIYDRKACEKIPEEKLLSMYPPTYRKRRFNSLADLELCLMSSAEFSLLLKEFSLFPLQERLDFLETAINSLGTRVDIDHFLSIFNHCVDNEIDYRIWRWLIIGFKMLFICMNNVNRSRLGLRLNEYLKRSVHRVLNRIGWYKEDGEDEMLDQLRIELYHAKLITFCKHTIRLVLEEYTLIGDISASRRMIVWPYIVRFGFKFEELLEMLRCEEHETPFDTADEIRKFGTRRENILVSLAYNKTFEQVEFFLGRMIRDESVSTKELFLMFQVCIQQCFDLRLAARDAFKRNHAAIKARMPVNSPEYQKIFVMFYRFTLLDHAEEDNWVSKFVYKAGEYTAAEKKFLPLTQMTQSGESYRTLLKKCVNMDEYVRGYNI